MVWLRLLHIVAGCIWVGAAVIMALFLLPTARAAGPEGERFLGRLMQRTGPAFGISMLFTIIPGLIMYGRDSGGFNSAWMGTHYGLSLTVGAAAAILAVVIGMGFSGAGRSKVMTLRKTLAAEGRAPNVAEAAVLAGWQTKSERLARVAASLLVIAAGAMAVARYL